MVCEQIEIQLLDFSAEFTWKIQTKWNVHSDQCVGTDDVDEHV